LNSSATRAILEDALIPMLEKNIDTVVLGCTHYPFVIPLIQEIAGDQVRVIDPAPAVSRQVRRLLEAKDLVNESGKPGRAEFFTSGAAAMEMLLPKLLGEGGQVQPVQWGNDQEIILR